jgi:hypothetical protein
MENLSKDKCPRCGYEIDAHSNADSEATPKANDVSICLKCAGFNKFDENLKLVEFTAEDMENTDPSLLAEMDHIASKIKAHNTSLN